MKAEMHIFTPRESCDSQARYRMELNSVDILKVRRGSPWSATVTDQSTGRAYDVEGAACSSPNCFCDAVVVRRRPQYENRAD